MPCLVDRYVLTLASSLHGTLARIREGLSFPDSRVIERAELFIY